MSEKEGGMGRDGGERDRQQMGEMRGMICVSR